MYVGFPRCVREPVKEAIAKAQTLTEALWRAGFVIERLVEPLPNDDFKQADPEHYAELMQFPVFMCVRARKIAAE